MISLATIDDVEPQVLFDYIVNALRKQGCRSLDIGTEFCRYRGSNGTKCAAGHVITDDEYNPNIEGKLIQFLVVENGKIEYNRIIENTSKNIDILRALQQTHDNFDVKDWEERFNSNAQSLGLKYTPKE
jgi:hypothetical protein